MINVSMLVADFPGQEEIADELIFSLARGNREALKIIYEKSINALYAYVLSLTKNKYDTEDVLQETYVSIAENASSYRGGRKGGREVFLFLRGKSETQIAFGIRHADFGGRGKTNSVSPCRSRLEKSRNCGK